MRTILEKLTLLETSVSQIQAIVNWFYYDPQMSFQKREQINDTENNTRELFAEIRADIEARIAEEALIDAESAGAIDYYDEQNPINGEGDE